MILITSIIVALALIAFFVWLFFGRTVLVIVTAVAVPIIIWLAVMCGIAYVVWHFIAKAW